MCEVPSTAGKRRTQRRMRGHGEESSSIARRRAGRRSVWRGHNNTRRSSDNRAGGSTASLALPAPSKVSKGSCKYQKGEPAAEDWVHLHPVCALDSIFTRVYDSCVCAAIAPHKYNARRGRGIGGPPCRLQPSAASAAQSSTPPPGLLWRRRRPWRNLLHLCNHQHLELDVSACGADYSFAAPRCN